MNIAVQRKSQVARPIKILVPLIKQELERGDRAGHDHYRLAGEMLIEAKESDQVPRGSWSQWLTKNFDLGQRTAQLYMQWARDVAEQKRTGSTQSFRSLNEMRGQTERERENRKAKQQQAFKRTLRDIARDDYAQERQSRDDENKLHRELALQLIDLGFRALATKLHPDRGGSRDAMARLNQVRDELKSVAQTRRFV